VDKAHNNKPPKKQRLVFALIIIVFDWLCGLLMANDFVVVADQSDPQMRCQLGKCVSTI
jgi:hypothetical protein